MTTTSRIKKLMMIFSLLIMMMKTKQNSLNNQTRNGSQRKVNRKILITVKPKLKEKTIKSLKFTSVIIVEKNFCKSVTETDMLNPVFAKQTHVPLVGKFLPSPENLQVST